MFTLTRTVFLAAMMSASMGLAQADDMTSDSMTHESTQGTGMDNDMTPHKKDNHESEAMEDKGMSDSMEDDAAKMKDKMKEAEAMQ